MEDVVISFTGWARPDVSSSIPGVVRQNLDMWALTMDSCTLSSLTPGGTTTDLEAVPESNIFIFSLIFKNPALYMEYLYVKLTCYSLHKKKGLIQLPSPK